MAARRAESSSDVPPEGTRSIVTRGFTMVEDVVYVGLGLLLSVSAIVLLGHTAISFSHELLHAALPNAIVGVLGRLLLVLMIVELLYTVQVSFREHALVPEPFLIVGLVAATRRVLVLTAEFTGAQAPNEAAFRVSMIELSVLTILILVLVASLVLLRSRHPDAVATRG
jgi:uncharacterized membrane protein (DUF373 family)